MVEAESGALLTCSDAATQQFVKFLNQQRKISEHEFIQKELDDTHLFVNASVVEEILREIDAFSDSNAYNQVQTSEMEGGKAPKRKVYQQATKKK